MQFLGFSLDKTLSENSCYKIQYIFVGTHCKRREHQHKLENSNRIHTKGC